MYHAACKVEFQPFKRSYSQMAFFNFLRIKSFFLDLLTMETRCSKVIFPNYSKKKPAEETLVPPLWGTREKNARFSRIICSRCCTRRNLRFHFENCQHADQKTAHATIGLRSRHRSNPRPTRFVSGKAGECR